ncbi:hypothetical protein [Streptomyces sp. NPDC093261]|uniref:hypothetical protein n=1 Tax=Streptomyces sp. NPDC093261 TaxID=3366037 RepID=UPI0038005301
MIGDVRLAAVSNPNPDHSATWAGFFWALLGVGGCLIVVIGAALTVALWSVSDQKKLGNYVLGPVILVIGLVVVGWGFGLW